MSVFEYTVQWTGGRIGLGFTNWHIHESGADNLAAISTAIRTWYDAVNNTIPNSITNTFPAEVKVLDESTGTLENAVPVTPLSPLTGGGSGTYSANTGRLVRWNTGEVAGGRRITGRTFLVPNIGTAFDSSGSVAASTLSTDNTAHAALLAATQAGDFPQLVVWSKKNGSVHFIRQGVTLAKATTLRRRND